jgi:hypothetical protein
VCRQLSSDGDWAQSVELRMRCDERFVDRTSHLGFVVAKAETNRKLVEAGRGAWFGAFLDGQLVSQMGLLAPASHASSRSRRTRVSDVEALRDHSCTTPAVTGSRFSEFRHW